MKPPNYFHDDGLVLVHPNFDALPKYTSVIDQWKKWQRIQSTITIQPSANLKKLLSLANIYPELTDPSKFAELPHYVDRIVFGGQWGPHCVLTAALTAEQFSNRQVAIALNATKFNKEGIPDLRRKIEERESSIQLIDDYQVPPFDYR